MSDAGIEATGEDPTRVKADEALVEARLSALLARWPERFEDDEIAEIKKKIAGHIGIARTLHGAPLDPSIEPPPFVPYRQPDSE